MAGTRVAVLLALLSVLGVGAFEESDSALLDHVRKAGGFVGFKIGRESKGGIRGAYADQDFTEGTLIARIPSSVALELGDSWSSPTELAKQYVDPSFVDTHGPFWNSLPGEEEVLSVESLTDDLVKELQASQLTHMISMFRETQKQRYEALPFRLRADKVSLDKFYYFASLISTRSFDTTVKDVYKKWLVPALDMVNSAPKAKANSEWTFVPTDGDEGVFELHATAAIKKGDQVTRDYPGAERNDVSFFIYGYITESTPPQLCGMDLLSWVEQKPFESDERSDDEIYEELEDDKVRQELQRVKQRLAQFPTTEAQDAKLLKGLQEGAAPRSWKKELAVRFRLVRKRALLHRLALLEDRLDELEGL